MTPKRILIATIGSLGDLHPVLAIGLELQRRGHQVTVATSHFYREKIEELGLAFRAIRPHWEAYDKELLRRTGDMKRAPEILFREIVLPEVRGTFEDVLAAAREADLILAGEIVYPVPLVAEKLGIPWVSAILSPSSFFSAYDPSVIVVLPWLIRLRKAGYAVNRSIINTGRLSTRHWWKPVRELRREHGLSPGRNPLFDDKFSRDLVLALFSRAFAKPQRDWPPHTVQPGFVFYDRDRPGARISPELAAFLDAGEPPIVFTLGSTAVHNQGDFAEISAAVARRLERRAVLLLGANTAPGESSPDILPVAYAPYSEVFSRAAVVVHQGGSGTTGQVLRAGRPMLVVPYGWDQPDNAERVQRLGTGLHLPRTRYTVARAAAALHRLLTEDHFAQKAAAVAAEMQPEQGLRDSCDAIEHLLLLRAGNDAVMAGDSDIGASHS